MTELRNAPVATLADDSIFPVGEGEAGTGLKKATGAELKAYLLAGAGDANFPDFDGHAGDVLAVNNAEDGVVWIDPPSGGGGGGAVAAGFRKLATIDLEGKSAFAFPNIPQTGVSLRLVVTGKLSAGSDIAIRMNGIADQVYDTQRVYANSLRQSGTATDHWRGETSWTRFPTFSGVDNPATAEIQLDFDNYTQTNSFKTGMFTGRQPDGEPTAAYAMTGSFQSRVNAAIASLEMTTNGATFAAGSKATLYVIGEDAVPNNVDMGGPVNPSLSIVPPFINGGSNFDAATFTPLRATKTGRLVSLEGVVRAAGSNGAVANMPVGWRPTHTALGTGESDGKIARVDVQPNGDIVIGTATGNINSYVTISITYQVPEADAYNPVSGSGAGATSGGDLVTGWRRSSDGWLEQWGACGGSQASADSPIVFPVPFAEGVVNITGNTWVHPGFNYLSYSFDASDVTLTGFTPRPRYNQGTVTDKPGEAFRWFARGK